MPQEVIIRAFISDNDGGIHYDVYLDPVDVEGLDDLTSDDGGICTSGEDKPDEPHAPTDWKAALEMATSQAVELLERTADHERRINAEVLARDGRFRT